MLFPCPTCWLGMHDHYPIQKKQKLYKFHLSVFFPWPQTCMALLSALHESVHLWLSDVLIHLPPSLSCCSWSSDVTFRVFGKACYQSWGYSVPPAGGTLWSHHPSWVSFLLTCTVGHRACVSFWDALHNWLNFVYCSEVIVFLPKICSSSPTLHFISSFVCQLHYTCT